MIQLQNLTYTYGTFKALDSVSANIAPGIHLLLGENGAGKTTLLHCIAGLRTPQRPESCLVDGMPSALRLPEMMQRVFILTDEMELPYNTLYEMVRYHSVFYPRFSSELLENILRYFNLSLTDKINRLSLGNRKKAKLAYALSLQTDVLLLDEPANGLDITAKQALLETLARAIQPTQTVIISTHTVWDFQNLFEGLIVMRHGHIILSMPTWDVAERIDFVNDSAPIDDAIFMQQNFGRYYAITPRRDPERPAGDLDYLLLYNALQSPQQSALLTQLTKTVK